MKPWLTAIREHALNVRWCSRHVGKGRRYRGGKRRCHRCGYFLPIRGLGVFAQILQRDYAPRLAKILAAATPLVAMFGDHKKHVRVHKRMMVSLHHA